MAECDGTDVPFLLWIPWHSRNHLYYESHQYDYQQYLCGMKEIGMMQAIGLSEKQLMKMLQMEGLFYTTGALILSIVFGSLAGYGAFCYAKADGMFNIQYFHYPVEAMVAMIIIVFSVQVVLVFLIGRSLRKQSMIDRIRFNE